jgi:hypothetical protein
VSTVVYRVVGTNPPTVNDFKSHMALGRVRPSTNPMKQHLFEGVSVLDSLKAARDYRRQNRLPGQFIAELTIPDDAPLRLEKTGLWPHHYDIYDADGNESDPSEILRCVTNVVSA